MLIGLLIGVALGWLLKYAFDFYHDFKKIEEVRAGQLEDILVKFKMLEEMKKYGNDLKKIGKNKNNIPSDSFRPMPM